MLKRSGWDEYYLNIALAVAQRATCIRRRYGAIVVKNFRIISSGYCGAPRNVVNCSDHGNCVREQRGAKTGEHYEWCVSVHGEANAIINAAPDELKGATIYIMGFDANTGEQVCSEPCLMCRRMIINACIEKVVYMDQGQIIIKEVKEFVEQ